MSPKSPSAPPESLASAYAATDFIVLALRPITLRVDESVTGLDEWLQLQRVQSAVVVSARSPFSQPLAEAEEDRRHEELRELVEGSGLRSTPAVGRPRRGNWQPERCLCVFDVAEATVSDWMRRFEQYAVVLAAMGQGCSLRWHPDLAMR